MGQIADSRAGTARFAAKLVGQPAFWLALQMLVVWLVIAASGGLRPQHVPDTQSYIVAAGAETFADALSNIRTYGYPFLINRFSDGADWYRFGRLIVTQRLAFLAAVFFFWWALSRFFRAPWLAFVAASALLYSPIVSLAQFLQPDFLAGAFIIAAIASLMLLSVSRSSIWWVVLAASLFASYQLRPAGIFLVGLVPLLGWVYQTVRNRRPMRQAATFAGALALVCFVPYLTFATVRWATVGHFGLVSFGGVNAAGMAVCFLDGKLIENLPRNQQSMARSIARARKKAGYEPMRFNDDPQRWFEQYSTNIFRIGLPAAGEQLDREARRARGDPSRSPPGEHRTVEKNRRLGALAKEIVRRRPAQYRRWFVSSMTFGVDQLDDWPSLSLPFWSLVVSLSLALILVGSGHRVERTDGDPRARALICLTLTAVAFFVFYMVLVALVSFPFKRYFASIALFLPPLLAALLFEVWRVVLPALRSSAE